LKFYVHICLLAYNHSYQIINCMKLEMAFFFFSITVYWFPRIVLSRIHGENLKIHSVVF
jgi:hypothetical protein